MLETERHRIILSAVQDRPVVTVADLCALTGVSEATVRRDIAQLHVAKKLRRVRGGAEAIAPPQFVGINARPFAVNQTIRMAEKRAIAQAAVDLCQDGDAIIINGGTTTFQIQAEQKLIGQADELIVLADSSKFDQRSSLLLCPLARIHTVITDEGIDDRAARMLEAAEIRLIVAEAAPDNRKRAEE